MNKKAVLLWIVALLLLASCGGGNDAEPAAPAEDNNTSSSATTETEEEPVEEAAETAEEEMAEEEVAEEAPAEEEMAEESDEAMEEEMAEEEVVEEAPAEEAAPASPFGDRTMSGVDADTGLVVNPEAVNPGDAFIVRGEIISMNLTPTTSPEFLIQSPDGLKFRLRSQDLADTFYEDGDQLQAFQYQIGLLAEATAILAADAGPSDIPSSTNLVLIKDE